MNIKELSSSMMEVEDKIEITEELVIKTIQTPGSKTGFYKEFFPEGQLKSTSYWRKGHLNGELFRYDVYGNLEEHAYYKDGKMIKSLFNLNGLQEQKIDKKLIEVAQYNNGKLNGEFKRWNDGRLILHGIYSENELMEKIEDGREFNSLVNGENEMNEELNTKVNYNKFNLSFGRFNEDKSEFVVPAFPGKNNIKEIKKIVESIDTIDDVIFDGSNYYFFMK